MTASKVYTKGVTTTQESKKRLIDIQYKIFKDTGVKPHMGDVIGIVLDVYDKSLIVPEKAKINEEINFLWAIVNPILDKIQSLRENINLNAKNKSQKVA